MGVETDPNALVAAFNKAFAAADIIVIDSGDLARADWEADELPSGPGGRKPGARDEAGGRAAGPGTPA